MAQAHTILIADDHAVVREGLRNLLVRAGYDVVAEAASAEEAVAAARAHRPALILLDLGMPGVGGLEALNQICAHDAEARVLVFTMFDDVLHASRAMKLGARGYLSKSDSPDDLLDAISRVLDGDTVVPSSLASTHHQPAAATRRGAVDELTRREFEIFRRLVADESLQAIAEALGISYQSVANVQTQIRQKLDATSLVDLKRIAIASGLLR